MAHPEYAYDEKRLQYNAGLLLKTLASEVSQDYDKVLGVLDVDLFVPILTYVFGEAQQGGRCAIVSIFRFRRNPDRSASPSSLLLERSAKVAMHEVGHLLDLGHCMDEKCLMHFSGGLEDVDKAPLYFCRYCTVYLRDALRKTAVDA
jgi:archaemetzincin